MCPLLPVAFALGANLGDRGASLAAAAGALVASGIVSDPLLSSVYETSPLGEAQPAYLNQVLVGRSRAGPRELLDLARAIEERLGRVRDGTRWGPRVIDVDLLVVGGEVRREPDLVLPHPGIAARRFVLEPWAEVDPRFVVPGLGRSVDELLAELLARGDRSTVERRSPADLSRERRGS